MPKGGGKDRDAGCGLVFLPSSWRSKGTDILYHSFPHLPRITSGVHMWFRIYMLCVRPMLRKLSPKCSSGTRIRPPLSLSLFPSFNIGKQRARGDGACWNGSSHTRTGGQSFRVSARRPEKPVVVPVNRIMPLKAVTLLVRGQIDQPDRRSVHSTMVQQT